MMHEPSPQRRHAISKGSVSSNKNTINKSRPATGKIYPLQKKATLTGKDPYLKNMSQTIADDNSKIPLKKKKTLDKNSDVKSAQN